jgi:flagellar biosynthetic protein FliR
MNIFSVGVPATLMAGLVLLAIAAPSIGDGIVAALQRSLATARHLALG